MGCDGCHSKWAGCTYRNLCLLPGGLTCLVHASARRRLAAQGNPHAQLPFHYHPVLLWSSSYCLAWSQSNPLPPPYPSTRQAPCHGKPAAGELLAAGASCLYGQGAPSITTLSPQPAFPCGCLQDIADFYGFLLRPRNMPACKVQMMEAIGQDIAAHAQALGMVALVQVGGMMLLGVLVRRGSPVF